MSLSNEINLFIESLGAKAIADNDLTFILSLIKPSEGRTLSATELRNIHKQIKRISTGKQRQLKSVLSLVLYYLSEKCYWVLPETQEQVCRDIELEKAIYVNQQAYEASLLFDIYPREMQQFFQERQNNIPLLVLSLGMTVAPLALHHIVNILNTPNSIQVFNNQLTLVFYHTTNTIASSWDEQSYTRYALPPTVCRMLTDHYRTDNLSLSVKQLTQLLNNYIELNSLPMSSKSAVQWEHCFLNIWLNEYHLPAMFVKDLNKPDRHVAFCPQTRTLPEIDKALPHIYDEDLANDTQASSMTIKKTKNNSDLPHKVLLKKIKKGEVSVSTLQDNDIFPPKWQENNILPVLFYLFTTALLTLGGVHKSTLRLSSIEKYTSIFNLFEQYPLSYSDASDPDLLLAWAHQVYSKCTTDNEKWLAVNFLRYLPQISLTEHFDSSDFISPFIPPKIDAFRINAEQFNAVLYALLTQQGATCFQRLFCVVILILGFYAGLRRGEILRLRLCDIVTNNENKGNFHIHVTNTDKGKTKNGKSRVIYTSIPLSITKFIDALLQLKSTCLHNSLLIGFEDESFNASQRYYFLPITRALKTLLGSNVRFHHLRHSAAHWLTLQGLHLATEQNGSTFNLAPSTQQLLTKECCEQRYDYWLQGRPFADMNDDIFFDVISKQLGHEDYSTTRLSYLHGIEWLPEFFIAPHAYTQTEIRYLLDIAPNSNDVSRFLNTASASYSVLPIQDKKHFKLVLSHNEMGRLLQTKKTFKQLPQVNSSPLPKLEINVSQPIALFKYWIQNIPNSTHQKMGNKHIFNIQSKQLISTLNNEAKEFTFEELSQYLNLTHSHQQLSLTKKQLNTIKQIGSLSFLSGENNNNQRGFILKLRCTHTHAQMFQEIFRHPLFHCFCLSFLLKQNRKQAVAKNKAIVENDFAQRNEPVIIETISVGKTELQIQFLFKLKSAWLYQHIADFLSSIWDISL
ncbi:tyrosine-type recombinase/integrase [Photobacterium carnosum]|uniref:tyrosine-type recombinase/integrase n=1 Tax=Photobacterium carnosum TaxID=2023717 RepID=UPI001E45AA59|nr:hypothetical protein [Photobacterium carnosum]MCD9529104.1 tyrosine-type recombinase/integrase [Photobacterium carnosum]